MKFISFSLALMFGLTPIAFCADLRISSLKITYKDTVSAPGRVTIRELKSFQDNQFWSKPKKIDIAVEVKNESVDESALFVTVVPEMYLLLKKRTAKYPVVKIGNMVNDSDLKLASELKSIMTGPVWVWNRSLGNQAIRELKPGQKLKVEFSDLYIGNEYYPVDYQISGIAIRVFADLNKKNDQNYSNNVADSIIMYGD